MAGGVEKNIVIKKNEMGFEFGLSVATGGGEAGQKEYKAEWSTSMSRIYPRNCFASNLMP